MREVKADYHTSLSQKGTYILILNLKTAQKIEVGRLGEILFASGFYLYIGSALGPGGLRARLKHHLNATKNPHWHIDYLKTRAKITGIWFAGGGQQRECTWAGILSECSDLEVAASGFGASDCQCQTHLFYSNELPDFDQISRLIGNCSSGENGLQRLNGNNLYKEKVSGIDFDRTG